MRTVIILLAVSIIYSCHKPAANEISKIEFAKGTCFGPDNKFDKVTALFDTSYKLVKLHLANSMLPFGTTLQKPLVLYKR
jgi:hypothetical protein